MQLSQLEKVEEADLRSLTISRAHNGAGTVSTGLIIMALAVRVL